jgi:2-methylisocitrate lyase-like PEP mutase family enzyme
MTQEEKARLFAGIHANTFVLPNAWDAASARIYEEEHFPAVATTSAGVAFALGFRDGQRVPAGEMIAAIGRIARAVAVPVSADVEAGYGDPVGTAQRVWEAGAVGINLEDVTGDEPASHVDLDTQVDVIRRIRTSVPDLVVNARTDIFLMGIGEESTRLARTIERLKAYRDAGAHCLFAPGLKDAGHIRKLVTALSAPLNILGGPGVPAVPELRNLDVKRISVGSGPMRACLGLVQRIARELQENGTYAAIIDGQYPYSEANRLFEQQA